MRRIAFIVLVFLGIVLLSLNTHEAEALDLKMVSIMPDRNVYHSADTMDLTLVVWANQNTSATLETTGVAGRVNVERQVNLTEGLNELHVTQTLPSCNKCSGISAGTYPVTCRVSHENVSVNDTVEIEIQQ